MRSQAPAAFIAVIVTLAACAIAFLAYLMWNSKNDSSDAASATTTVVSITTQTVTETPSTVTVTSSSEPSETATSPDDEYPTTSRENDGGSYAAVGQPCTSAEAGDRVRVGRRTLVCTYQGPESTNEYEWEYRNGEG